ncbi:hypothetical protein [Streptomyces xanthophaeus]|uniref:hypothetical protein n=1 Tax=Streptomyces xanthophaeus TaxID=67385 RepID=UPI00264A00EC|nr:hypothetical protein [Streptomyces xanthophaeus]WKD30621.1 hypothetical protein KO717_00610 [Streptomyces xanthophaeus]
MTEGEIRALAQELVALDVAAGARWAVGTALGAVRTVGRSRPLPQDGAERAARAELYQVAAWIAFDAERHGVSRRLHLRALELARSDRAEGPDAAVEPLILAVLAMQEEHLGRPGSSLRIASSVLARAGLPGRVAAIFHVRAARALARMGDGPRARRALGTAAELLADPPTDRDPAWAWWFDRHELDGHHGLALAALGDLGGAAALLHDAAHAGGDGGPAYRMLFAAELARVQALAGDWRGAGTAMAALVDGVPAVGSVRALRVMGRAARLVEDGRRVPRRTRDTARHLALAVRDTGTGTGAGAG